MRRTTASNFFRRSPVFDSFEFIPAKEPIAQRIGPDSLGCCDLCGVDVPLDGHLRRQPAGGYACDSCDMSNAVLDCSEEGQ